MRIVLLLAVGLCAVGAALAEARNQEQQCLEGSRWFDGCNQCRCIRGGAACTKKGCYGPTGKAISSGQQSCTPGSRWMQDDCNWCDCHDGLAVCTERACYTHDSDPEPDVAVAVQADASEEISSEANPDAVCRFTTVNDRWRRGCNWCSCTRRGVPRCTKRSCSQAINTRLEGTKRCEGEPAFKIDCNWCTCKSGLAVCTLMFCGTDAIPIAPAPAPAPAPVQVTSAAHATSKQRTACTTKSPEHRWREGCNWCSCGPGNVASCTERACSAAIVERLAGTKECEGNPRWKENNCNWCNCAKGNAICTRRACFVKPQVEAQGETQDNSQDGISGRGLSLAVSPPEGVSEDDTCVSTSPHDRWRSDCNWCRCLGGKGACTRRGCPPALRDQLDSSTKCEGSIQWKDGCSWCSCDNGNAVCDDSACPKEVTTQDNELAGVDCTDGSRWTESCNECYCSFGQSLCTKIGCIKEVEDTCEEGSTYTRDNCNWCTCVNGRPSCTEKACFDGNSETQAPQPAPVIPGLSTAGTSCTNGSRWTADGCNWCNCVQGAALCTQMVCLDQVEADALTCVEGSSWSDGCNQCGCSNGRSICTLRACIEHNPKPEESYGKSQTNKPISHERQDVTLHGRPSFPIGGVPRDDRQCTPGSRFSLDGGCNWCSCSDNGIAACTLMACFRSQDSEAEENICTDGSRWRSSCNWCNCVGGRGVCTQMGCLSDLPQLSAASPATKTIPENDECSEGSRWRKDCNWCNCNKGRGVCTRKACLPGRVVVQDECVGESMWRSDCNTCMCMNGTAACTLKGCISRGAEGVIGAATTLVGVSSHRSEVSATAEEAKDEEECVPGSEFRHSCNWCTCNEQGLKMCTKKMCHPGETFESDCVGQAEFLAEGNCKNWCACINGEAVCPKKVCTPTETPIQVRAPLLPPPGQGHAECVTGTNWQEFCNQCQCHNGRKMCTRRTCFFNAPDTTETKVERCSKPADSGPCFASFRMFRFNQDKDRCEPFLYGGCKGNANRFATPELCHLTCGGEAPVMDTSCDRKKCPEYRENDFYDEKGCTPVYEDGQCCASRYDCPGRVAIDTTKCHYKGVQYEMGQDIDVDDACSRCRCSGQSGTAASISCLNIECPSLFNPPTPGCRDIHSLDRCCAIGKKCEDDVPSLFNPTIREDSQSPDVPKPTREETHKCHVDGQAYEIGMKMYPDSDDCQKCICSANYTGPYGPGCKKIDCGYHFRYQEDIRSGCIPLYFKERCCPISFICPGDSNIAAQQTRANPDGETENVCHFGDVSVAVGEVLQVTDAKITCTCKTPPSVTCVRTRS